MKVAEIDVGIGALGVEVQASLACSSIRSVADGDNSVEMLESGASLRMEVSMSIRSYS